MRFTVPLYEPHPFHRTFAVQDSGRVTQMEAYVSHMLTLVALAEYWELPTGVPVPWMIFTPGERLRLCSVQCRSLRSGRVVAKTAGLA
jgi:hypothetical protein